MLPLASTFVSPTFVLIFALFEIAWYILFFYLIINWLMAFGILNPTNRTIQKITRGLDKVTAPILKPIRLVLPTLRGLDFSPLILLFALRYIRELIFRILAAINWPF